MVFGIMFNQISNYAEFQKTRFRIEGIAKIKVEDLQKASKIHIKSHRKWDRNKQRKIIPKSIQNGPKIHSKSIQKCIKK